MPAVMTPGRWAAKVPAIASAAMIGRKRPTTIASARAMLYHTVLPLKPAKALPLLAAELVNAYSTSESPCGPAFSIDARSQRSDIATAVPVKTAAGRASM